MKKRTKVKIAIGVAVYLILAIPVIYVGYEFYRIIKALGPQYERVEIRSESLDESIFLKGVLWGGWDSHQKIFISSSPELEFHPDSTSDYVFQWEWDFLYRFENDTLTVYSSQWPEVPEIWPSQIIVDRHSYYPGLRDSMEFKRLKELDVHPSPISPEPFSLIR